MIFLQNDSLEMELFEQNVIMFTFEHIFFFFLADHYVADLLNYDLKCTW